MTIDWPQINPQTIGGIILLIIGVLMGGKPLLQKIPGLTAVLQKLLPAVTVPDVSADVSDQQGIVESLTQIRDSYQSVCEQNEQLRAELERRDRELKRFASTIRGESE